MKIITVAGVDVVANHVTGVEKVTSISTGPMICDWDYGFVIKTTGQAINVTVPTKTDSLGNHLLSREGRYRAAQDVRNEFINELKLIVDE